MAKQNFLEQAKQNLQAFYWPAWFPYPSSWLRALILVPLALPGTHLIVWGLTGIIISVVENRPLLLLFSIWLGILLPTIFLAFLYHFFWYIWHQQNSKNNFSRLLPSLSSIWQGLYTIFVLASSFIIIVSLLSELTFLECKYFQIKDALNICNGHLNERAVKLIFSSIENKTFFIQPWFIIWLSNVSYLYQCEFLFKKFLNKNLRLIWKKQRRFQTNDTIVLEKAGLQDDVEIKQFNKNKTQQRPILVEQQQYYQKNQKNQLVKIVFNFLAVVSAGLYFFTKLPLIKENLTLYISQPNISSQIQSHPNLFPKISNKVIPSAKEAQSATSQKEWKKILAQWQAATSLMKKVPPAKSNHAIKQQKITKSKKK